MHARQREEFLTETRRKGGNELGNDLGCLNESKERSGMDSARVPSNKTDNACMHALRVRFHVKKREGRRRGDEHLLEKERGRVKAAGARRRRLVGVSFEGRKTKRESVTICTLKQNREE